MFDRTQIEELRDRIGIVAIRYYPDKPDHEPGWTLADDIAWCLDALPTLEDSYRAGIASSIADVIVDPTTHREAFLHALDTLANP